MSQTATTTANPIALNYCSNLNELAGDLIRDMDLGNFCYHRIYKDGSEIMLSNTPKWTEHWYKNKYLLSSVIKDWGLTRFEHFVAPANSEQPTFVLELKEICNINQGVGLRFINENYCDFFGLNVADQNGIAINSLLNNLDFLKNFCSSLSKTLELTFKKCEVNRIIPFVKPDIDLSFFLEKKREIGSLLTQTPLLNLSLFSNRETDCIKKLLLGKTMREAAEELFVSPRTVETHMENIKNKLGCNKKSEVITFLFKNGFAERFLSEIC